jgi:DnaJ-class molecular chaperone
MEHIHVEILQCLGDEACVISCAFCERKGRYPTAMKGWRVQEWSHLEECPVCDGRGILEIGSIGLPIPDAYCNGTGHEPHDTLDAGLPHTRCHKCGGIGARALYGKITLLGAVSRTM